MGERINFNQFRDQLIENFLKITENVNYLYEVEFDSEKFYNLYLDSFPEGTNEIFRERRYFDCNYCKNFIRRFGGVVVIKDLELKTIWDFKAKDKNVQVVIDAMNNYIKSKPIKGFYFSNYKQIGIKQNVTEEYGKIVTYSHFYVELPDKFVYKRERELNEVLNELNTTAGVFKRSLQELTIDSTDIVLELINDNNLYRGDQFKFAVEKFNELQKSYSELTSDREKELFVWENCMKESQSVGKIRNTSIGTLLIDISENMSLDKAVEKFENLVSGTNYKRSKAIYTPRMLEDFKNTLTELGYIESLKRRYATYDDIEAQNTLFLNRDLNKPVIDESKETVADDIFSSMEKDAVRNDKKKFSRVKEIGIKEFIDKILPTAKSIEAYVENKHDKNFVSLITSLIPNTKSMFKWDNPFSWAYTGNIADSVIKNKVRELGGNVLGDVRFSISWNEDGTDNSDLDAHCVEPNGFRIYFGSRALKPGFSPNKGQLDVDIQYPNLINGIAVENIVYEKMSTMIKGKYVFMVNNYMNRNNKHGFKAELEVMGEVYSFVCDKPLRTDDTIKVAELEIFGDGTFKVTHLLPVSASTTRKVWGVDMNKFTPVTAIMLSPNYWGENSVGNKHYFFMLKDCINDESPNGFYNEYLNEDLYKHRKAAEALGNKCSVENSENQLSGLGFSSTKRNEMYVKVISGSETTKVERIFNLKF